MKIHYNAPVVLTYTFICVLVLGANLLLGGTLTPFFSAPAIFHPLYVVDYFRLFSHGMGHANWAHLLSNFTFILLIGPVLEEKYGSKRLLQMIGVTVLVTGVLNAVLFDTSLMGASGIVFMLILLGSIVNARQGRIPLTFILVVLLFLGQEVLDIFKSDNVSQFAHIIGGVCGAAFGFAFKKGRR
ncbi:rhomboid family intramembrane serine protease [Rapidithrix thailandica]|uniref:Rhomboid family intramembrane serine protease n=1 Tax=Rapidithrix thailandica TaxID=413964 RepID=A0AAW9S6K8_9BACT